MIGAPDKEGGATVVFEEDRCGVAVVVFVGHFEIPFLLPAQFAGRLVEPSNPGLTLMEASQNHVLVGQNRRGALVPEEFFPPELCGQIISPPDGTVEIQGRQDGAAK